MELTLKRLQEYLKEKYTISNPKDLKNTRKIFFEINRRGGRASRGNKKK